MNTLIVAVLLMTVQTSPPVPRKTADSATSTRREVQTQTQAQQRPATPAESAPQTNATQEHQDTRKGQGQQNTEQSIRVRELPPVTVTRDWPDWGYWAFTLMLVIVGAIQAGLLLGTLRQIRRQADNIESQTSILENAAKAAKANAEAAREQAETAKESARTGRIAARATLRQMEIAAKTHAVSEATLESAKKSADAALLNAQAVINAERAWIVVEPMNRTPEILYVGLITPSGAMRNAVGISIKNVGRTPARILRSCLIYVYVDSLAMLPNEPQYLDISVHQGLILVPNGEPIGHVAFLRPNAQLTPEQCIAITQKRAFVYAYGFVEYDDTVGGESSSHVTRFGYVYNFPQGGEPQVLKGLMPGGPPAYNDVT